MELYNGRPESTEGRLPREIRTYDYLDTLGIPYQRTDHERADNMEACNEIDAVLGVIICKNLFLCNRQKTVFYLLMMPGDKKFKTKELSAQIQSARLSFAEPEDMLKYLDIEPGAVSIMGLMNDHDRAVHLLVDASGSMSSLCPDTNIRRYEVANQVALSLALGMEHIDNLTITVFLNKLLLHPLGPYWYLHTLVICGAEVKS